MRASLSNRMQRRALRGIERDLAADRQLAGLFLTFTRVNAGEVVPGFERVKHGSARRAWRRILAVLTFVFPPQPLDTGLRTGPPGSR